MNEANLTPFQPGQSGNPAGKPKGARNLSTLLAELLEEETEVNGVKMPFKNAIIKKLIKKANTGNVRAIEQVFDRIDGKAKQEIKVEGALEIEKVNYEITPPKDPDDSTS